MTHPERSKQGKLDDFAKRVEAKIKASCGHGMENLLCRLLTGDDVKVAAALAAKWVEWRYGKPTERHEVTGASGGPIEHTIRFGDGA